MALWFNKEMKSYISVLALCAFRGFLAEIYALIFLAFLSLLLIFLLVSINSVVRLLLASGVGTRIPLLDSAEILLLHLSSLGVSSMISIS